MLFAGCHKESASEVEIESAVPPFFPTAPSLPVIETSAPTEEPTTAPTEPAPQIVELSQSYTVNIPRDDFPIYGTPGYDAPRVGVVEQAGIYTIVTECRYPDGSLWGKLKSGAGWVCVTDIYNPQGGPYDLPHNQAYILPFSSDRLLTEADVSFLSLNELILARNEIYARHGRLFDSADLQAYFDSKAWYSGTTAAADFSQSILSNIEEENIHFIKDQEAMRKQIDPQILKHMAYGGTTVSQLRQYGFELTFERRLNDGLANVYRINDTDVLVALGRDAHGIFDEPVVVAISAPADIIIPNKIGSSNYAFQENGILFVPDGKITGDVGTGLFFGFQEDIPKRKITKATNVCFTGTTPPASSFDWLLVIYLNSEGDFPPEYEYCTSCGVGSVPLNDYGLCDSCAAGECFLCGGHLGTNHNCDDYPNVVCSHCGWGMFTTGVGLDGISCRQCGAWIIEPSYYVDESVAGYQWKMAYLKYIFDLGNAGDLYTYKLVNVDADGIPELFVHGGDEAAGSIICAYKNGQVVEQHLRRLGGASYIPGSGLVRNCNGNMGNYSTDIYRLGSNGFTELFHGLQEDSYEEIVNEFGEYEYVTISRFYISNGSEVTEEAFLAAQSEIFDFGAAEAFGYEGSSSNKIEQQIRNW
jgi:hypothetical protein